MMRLGCGADNTSVDGLCVKLVGCLSCDKSFDIFISVENNTGIR
jgi:hypothetical protein